MPYKAKGKCVYNTDTGEKVGCTKGSVKKYLAALYANVPDAKNESKIKELKKPMKNIKLSEIAIKIINENKSAPLMLNGKEVDVSSIELDGVDTKDYPDFSNAYILAAYYVGGAKLTDKEISQLRSENPNLVNDLAHDNLHEGEEEEFRRGGKLHGQWAAAQEDLRNTRTCKKCHKKFIASYGEYERCPDCLSKSHAAGEKATGTQ